MFYTNDNNETSCWDDDIESGYLKLQPTSRNGIKTESIRFTDSGLNWLRREHGKEIEKRGRMIDATRKIKQKARSKLNAAIKKGTIESHDRCENCLGTFCVQAHHHDYESPLDVVFLCKFCHDHLHKRLFSITPTKYILRKSN